MTRNDGARSRADREGDRKQVGGSEGGRLDDESDTDAMAEWILFAARDAAPRDPIGTLARHRGLNNLSRAQLYPRLYRLIGVDESC